MRIWLSMPALATCLVCTLLTASGQQVQSPANGTQPIALNVVVTPGNHRKPVTGLAQTSFTVLDNGAPQPLTSFRAVTASSEPVKVLLVIDDVNVPYERVAYERQEIGRLLRANDGQLAQPTALAVFTDTGTQIQPSFSTDGNALSAELDKQVIGLRDLRRSAGFYGAAERLDLSVKTLDQLLARAESEPGRKFILWVSSGWPLLSGPEIQLTNKEEQHLFDQVVAFSDALRRSKTTLYAINPIGAGADPGRTYYYQQFVKGIRKPSQAVPADLGLQVLAEQSGGRFLTGSNDISGLLQECIEDATAHYELTFQAPPAEGAREYHHIEVRMADTQLKARTTEGYYSPR